VKASEAEKNFLAKKEASVAAASASVGSTGAEGVGDSRLYLGNLHVNITEEDLKVVLSQFGTVESVHIHRDEVGTSRGYAFVRFARVEDAQSAFSKLAGLELAGKAIKVGFVNDSGSSGVASTGQYSSGNWKLDDDEGSGLQMNAQSRAMLMAKLGQAAGIQVPVNPMVMALTSPGTAHIPQVVDPMRAPPVGGLPSVYIVIRNMFILAEEKGDSWDMDIREDVTEECEKFGKVEECHVDTKRTGGFVYVKFAAVDAASKAANSLNGRWFAGRMITTSFIDSSQYSAAVV